MTQIKYNAFEHASHNLKVHNYLKEVGDYPDWEITTAFYTSLKFFEGSLFPDTYLQPGKEDTGVVKEFQSFNEYKKLFHRFCNGTPHDIMKRFVQYNTTDELWRCYNDLYEICHNSRYKNYKIDPSDLKIATDSLETVKKYCIENQK